MFGDKKTAIYSIHQIGFVSDFLNSFFFPFILVAFFLVMHIYIFTFTSMEAFRDLLQDICVNLTSVFE